LKPLFCQVSFSFDRREVVLNGSGVNPELLADFSNRRRVLVLFKVVLNEIQNGLLFLRKHGRGLYPNTRTVVNNQKGVGLVMALLTLLLLSVLGAALISATTVDVWIGNNYQTATQLLYLTESGIEDGRETLSRGLLPPSPLPFIKDKALLADSGREVGRYSVYLVRSNPLTLQSIGNIGPARKTIEVRLVNAVFPNFPSAITRSEGAANDGVDTRLKTPSGAERLVEGIRRNATDVFESASLGPVGSPTDYRVVVVNGNCEFAGAAGYGILLVRGELTLSRNFAWNGFVLVIGQGVVRLQGSANGWVSGGIFVSRTKGADGVLLDHLGPTTFDLGTSTLNATRSTDEMDRANQRFPFVPTSYREF
jgi:hypothetical protein